MHQKSPTQEKIEAQRGLDIAAAIRDVLSKCRGQKNLIMLASIDLEVSDGTLYRWLDDLGIDIDDYRQPVAEQPANA